VPTLNWIGKEAVINHHLEVPFHLLKDVPDLGCSDPGAGNLIVEGDNLVALKALLPYYKGRVKCICIDPPYNTGNEGWAYNDNVNSPAIRKWLGETVGKEGETLDRHDRWLCMMAPRLALLREFLTEDGSVFVCLDDNEVHMLRCLMDEVFGSQNFVAQMIWEGAFKNDARQIGVNHEYVVVYAKNRKNLPREWEIPKEGADEVLREVARLKKLHGDDHEAASEDLAGWFRANKAKPCFANRRFRYIDARGAYKEDDPTAPGGRKFNLKDPRNGNAIPLRANRGWAFDQETFNRMMEEGRITFVSPTSVMVRRYFHETDTVTPQSVFYQPTRSASERLEKIIGADKFEFPKDETVLQGLIRMATNPGDLVMDSFAGSGTTAHAVLKMNAANRDAALPRRFILVEMEPGIATGITRERVRRVAEGYTNAKGEKVPGLGGSFRFARLGEAVFDEHGRIRESVRFAELARHVYFTETGEPLPRERVSARSPLLGIHRGRAVHLLYNGILKDRSIGGGNALCRETLRAILDLNAEVTDGPEGRGVEQTVVYGTSQRLALARLKREGIVFKQIPYAIRDK
jgi:adenine-specific DNA-methyltransferase